MNAETIMNMLANVKCDDKKKEEYLNLRKQWATDESKGHPFQTMFYNERIAVSRIRNSPKTKPCLSMLLAHAYEKGTIVSVSGSSIIEAPLGDFKVIVHNDWDNDEKHTRIVVRIIKEVRKA